MNHIYYFPNQIAIVNHENFLWDSTFVDLSSEKTDSFALRIPKDDVERLKL